MKNDFTLTQKDFNALLDWLSADRNEAGVLYEKMREGLIRFFRFRGCADPTTLADVTINRVALRIAVFDAAKPIKTTSYVYGFASNVLLEHFRTTKKREISLDWEETLPALNQPAVANSPDVECDCLENCLMRLPSAERMLVVRYYEENKSEKSAVRRDLAKAMNLKMPALHTKVFRIRAVLRECIEKCLEKNTL